MKRILSCLLLAGGLTGIAACGSTASGNGRQVSMSAHNTTATVVVPKSLSGGTAPAGAPGFVAAEYKNARQHRVVLFSLGPAGSQTVDSEMSRLVGGQPKPLASQVSTPSVNGAQRAKLVVLHFNGSAGATESVNLVATTASGALFELFTGKVLSDSGFDPMSVIHSVKLSGS